MGSSHIRAQTHVPCIGRRILNHCATNVFYLATLFLILTATPCCLPPMAVLSLSLPGFGETPIVLLLVGFQVCGQNKRSWARGFTGRQRVDRERASGWLGRRPGFADLKENSSTSLPGGQSISKVIANCPPHPHKDVVSQPWRAMGLESVWPPEGHRQLLSAGCRAHGINTTFHFLCKHRTSEKLISFSETRLSQLSRPLAGWGQTIK